MIFSVKTITIIFLVICATFVFLYSSDTKEGHGNVILRIGPLKNKKGTLNLNIFTSEEGFPDDHKKAYRIISQNITHITQTIMMTNCPHGYYAVSVLHDENDNKKMDTGLFGIPKEGYGFSKNAKGFFGPPDFEDAKCLLKEKQMTVHIKLNY
ncbi:MAG: DUF2141 domain-containing protein [Spirochaetes bacterium]|nr:DUF2141 domain-containing protein [Spirochaetota bacterium]